METLLPSDCDRASEVSFCLEDEAPPDSVLNTEETEELTQSLKDVVDTEDVKPKLQCLVVNPCFSIVTVQCEDSGIHWETSSSRCSTPWASEASTTSDVYSMDSSSVGTPGKVIFIMDEGKLRRKRVRAPSQFSRHKKNVTHQKPESDKNMEEAVKGALENAKSQSSKLIETTNKRFLDRGETDAPADPKPTSNEESAIKRKKFVDSKVRTLKTVPEQAAETKDISTEGSSEQSPTDVSSKDENRIPENADEDQYSSEMQSDLSDKTPTPDTVKVGVPLSDERLDQERSQTLNLSVSESFIGQPNSLPSHFTDTVDKIESRDIASNNMDSLIAPEIELQNDESILKESSMRNVGKKTETEVTQLPSQQNAVNATEQEVSECSTSALDDEKRQKEVSVTSQGDTLPMEDVNITENSSLKVATNNSKVIRHKTRNPNTVLDTHSKGDIKIAPVEETAKASEPVKKETSKNIKQQNQDKNTSEIDYFEKFTLIDDKVPVTLDTTKFHDEAEKTNSKQESVNPLEEKDNEYDYYLIEGFDESFYGVMKGEDTMDQLLTNGNSLQIEKSSDIDENIKLQEDSVKPTDTTLFNEEEGVLAKSLFFPTSYPINPELLQEPPALAFLYEDLYETATKHDKNESDAESTGSEATFHSRISDDDGTGIYFEKYNLKDEIPLAKVRPTQLNYFDDLPPDSSVDAHNVLNKHATILDNQGSTRQGLEKDHDSHLNAIGDEGQNIMDLATSAVPSLEEKGSEDIAKSLDYVVICRDDLLEDDMLHEELMFDERESLEHESDSGFVLVADAGQDLEESGFEIVEQEKPLVESETSLADGKNAQVDTYCYTCKIPILAIDKIFGDHKDHDVTAIDSAVNEMTANLEDLYEKLQDSSLKTEDFVSRVEALFNDVEKNCTETEKLLQEQNEQMIQKVLAHHTTRRESFEEMKKTQLEYLQDQIVNFQKNIDMAREVLEKAAKELEEPEPVVFLGLHDEMSNRLLQTLEKVLSLEKMPNAKSLFEKCAGGSTEENQTRLPVPQTPVLKAQEPNSATSSSIAVYWSMNKEDVIDCFQLFCMEEPQGNREDNGLLEEYRVTVKESFCILEDLEPDKCYNVWVMAVNNTGCSFPSERSTFRTAPSTPVIKAEECTICWDTAIIRWSTVRPESTDSFTLEWCKQYSSEGEGLRSITGVKDQQLKVTLQPNENYFFYVRAANNFGSSEQSEAALISTKGTRFHLLRDTAHPALDLSSDGTVISISEKSEITGIPLVLGELLPATGRHYWEMMVTGCSAYSVGATFQPSKEECPYVEESTSWCMQCYSSSTSFSYKFLHSEVLSEVHLTEPPVRVGILLDYTKGSLSFYNVQKGNLLFSFRHRFTEAAHPTFALEAHGALHLHTGIELPRFALHS